MYVHSFRRSDAVHLCFSVPKAADPYGTKYLGFGWKSKPPATLVPRTEINASTVIYVDFRGILREV